MRARSNLFVWLSLGLVLIGATSCLTGNRNYSPPSPLATPVSNSKEVDKPREQVWNELVSGLGAQFFVINNMDKASGFINVSYSGDPEKYIDGGELVFNVSNLKGDREYRFPGAQAHAQYEYIGKGSAGPILYGITRDLSLEGRMNILLSEVTPSRTRITVNTRYVLTLAQRIQNMQGQVSVPPNVTISFNTGGEGKAPAGTVFRPNGQFEADVLALVH